MALLTINCGCTFIDTGQNIYSVMPYDANQVGWCDRHKKGFDTDQPDNAG